MKFKFPYIFLLILFLGVSCYTYAQSESDIVITEIMYNPPESGTDSLEFIELYNKGTESIDLSGYTFSEGVTHTFAAGTSIEAESYLVVAVNAQAFEAFFGSPAIQWEGGALSNGGEDIILLDVAGNVMDSVVYDDEGDWVSEPDGSGPSLALCDPTVDNALGSNWIAATIDAGVNAEGASVFAHPNGACSEIDGLPPTPNALEVTSATSLIVYFNEAIDENSATNLVNYTGLGIASISLDANTTQVNVELSNPLILGIFEELRVANVQDLAGNSMSEPVTFDVVFNDTQAELVITEIYYNDPSGADSLEFVELLYLGTETAQIGGYTFSDGVTFTFPTMTVEPNEYIVVAKYPDLLEAFFGTTSMRFFGGLRNSGETVEIQNTAGGVIDVVDYGDSDPWPVEADGDGYSLNLCDVTADNSDVANWSIATDMDLAGVYEGLNVYATPGSEGCKTDVGIETLDGTKIDLFPNPANNELFVQIEGKTNWNLQIFNVLGQQILQTQTLQNFLQLDVGNFETGIYFVHFQGENANEYYVERIVVN